MYNEKAAQRTYKYVKKQFRVGFCLKPDVWERWHKFAVSKDLPLNTMIRLAVEEYLKTDK